MPQLIIIVKTNVHGGHLNVAHKSVNLFLIDGAMLKIGITMHVKSKYATGRTPRKFAVMQSTAGYYGHVAVVEQVYKNGSIKVSEYNFYRPLKYNTRVLSKKAARNFNYIY